MATLSAQPVEGWHWRTFTSRNGLAESWVRGVTRGPSGRVFISHGAVNALTVYDGYTMTSLPCPGPGLRVVEGPGGEAWASEWDDRQIALAGLQWFDGHQWVRIAGVGGAPRAYEGQIVPLASGRAAFLTPRTLVAVDARDHSTRVVLDAARTGLGEFLAVAEARSGGVWVTGTKGVTRLDLSTGGRFEVALAPGLSRFGSPLEGRPGDLWSTNIRRCGCSDSTSWRRRTPASMSRCSGSCAPRRHPDGASPYALYVRIRPWDRAAFDIQAGRVPPTFGAFARRHVRVRTTCSSATRSRIST